MLWFWSRTKKHRMMTLFAKLLMHISLGFYLFRQRLKRRESPLWKSRRLLAHSAIHFFLHGWPWIVNGDTCLAVDFLTTPATSSSERRYQTSTVAFVIEPGIHLCWSLYCALLRRRYISHHGCCCHLTWLLLPGDAVTFPRKFIEAFFRNGHLPNPQIR